jgi:hypothetical protein
LTVPSIRFPSITTTTLVGFAAALFVAMTSSGANAQAATEEPSSAPPEELPPEEPPARPAPAPYSLPFQLRPVTVATAVRSDTSFGAYDNTLAKHGFAVVSELTGSWRIASTGRTPGTGLAPLVKLTVVSDSPPGTATGGFAFVNPLVGGLYGMNFGSGVRASAFFCVTIPVGMGGGNTPDPGALDARTVGPVIRAGMDNPLFAVNDFSMIPGFDIAYVAHGLTLQAEATFAEIVRVRGEKAQLEASKTAVTGGVHAGYFLTDFLSLGAELRLQWWIDPPFAVQNNKPNTSYHLASLGVGPRLHFRLGPDVWIRPGVAYTRGFDPPMTPTSFNDNIVQLDIPVVL